MSVLIWKIGIKNMSENYTVCLVAKSSVNCALIYQMLWKIIHAGLRQFHQFLQICYLAFCHYLANANFKASNIQNSNFKAYVKYWNLNIKFKIFLETIWQTTLELKTFMKKIFMSRASIFSNLYQNFFLENFGVEISWRKTKETKFWPKIWH